MTSKENLPTKEKVLVYVLRRIGPNVQVLVFDHVDYPEVEPQIPGGGVKNGEEIMQAAVRELEEESGVTHAKMIRFLGKLIYDNPHNGKLARRHFFLLQAPDNLPEQWDHIVASTDDDNGLVFRFYWQELTQTRIGYEQDKGLDFMREEDLSKIK
ncbi:MAG: NUDIX domain-containing protein [Bacteroidota bacterium]